MMKFQAKDSVLALSERLFAPKWQLLRLLWSGTKHYD
jgi:hypothetical protein